MQMMTAMVDENAGEEMPVGRCAHGPGHLESASTEWFCPLVVQDHTQQRVIHVKAAVIVDESQLLEFVHEKVDA